MLLACGGAAKVTSKPRAETGDAAAPRSPGAADVSRDVPPLAATTSDAAASDIVLAPMGSEPEPGVSAAESRVATTTSDAAVKDVAQVLRGLEDRSEEGLHTIAEVDETPAAWIPFKRHRGWWKEFAGREAVRPRNPLSETVTPRVAMQLFGVGPTLEAYRAHRRWFGMYRACYERALAKSFQQGAQAGAVGGHWVAQLEQGPDGRISWVIVSDTTLPEEMSNCLKDELLYRVRGSSEARGLELVLTFHSP